MSRSPGLAPGLFFAYTRQRQSLHTSTGTAVTKKTPDLTGAAIASDRKAGGILDAKGQLPQDLKIEWVSITTVTPYPNNPRQNTKAIADVRASLVEFGWQQPIVVDQQGVIVVGHTRYYAALDLQQRQVPVYKALSLTPAQCKAYRLADNKIGERAEWDFPKLAVEFQQLQEMGVDLLTSGFREFEIQPIMATGWEPTPASGDLDSAANQKTPDPGLIRFTVVQLDPIMRAVERYRATTAQPQLDAAEAIAWICDGYAPEAE